MPRVVLTEKPAVTDDTPAPFADFANEVGNLERERANAAFGDPEEQRAVRALVVVVNTSLFSENLGPVVGFSVRVSYRWNYCF